MGGGVEAGKEFDRRAVRNHSYAGGGYQAGIDDDVPRCFGEHGDESCSRAELPQDSGLPGRGFGEHGVQGEDERLVQVSDQGEQVRAGVTAEDAELVLDEHNVDAPVVQSRRQPEVVVEHILTDDRENVGFAVRGWFAHDRDHVDMDGRVGCPQRGGEVVREGGDSAGSWRVGGNNGRAHGGRSS